MMHIDSLTSCFLLSFFKDWISVKENCLLNSALCNKKLRKVALKFEVIKKALNTVKRLKPQVFEIKVTSESLNVTFCREVFLKGSGPLRLRLDFKAYLSGRTFSNDFSCLDDKASLSQIIMSTKFHEEPQMFFFWGESASQNTYVLCLVGYDKTYGGEINSDLEFHGTGSMVHVDYTQFATVYMGQWSHGKRQGFGVFKVGGGGKLNETDEKKSIDQIYYQGQWENDLQHGQGVSNLPSTGIYSGDFVEGEMTGFGTAVGCPGTYIGQFVKGAPHGVMKFIDTEGVSSEVDVWNKWDGAEKLFKYIFYTKPGSKNFTH